MQARGSNFICAGMPGVARKNRRLRSGQPERPQRFAYPFTLASGVGVRIRGVPIATAGLHEFVFTGNNRMTAQIVAEGQEPRDLARSCLITMQLNGSAAGYGLVKRAIPPTRQTVFAVPRVAERL